MQVLEHTGESKGTSNTRTSPGISQAERREPGFRVDQYVSFCISVKNRKTFPLRMNRSKQVTWGRRRRKKFQGGRFREGKNKDGD